MRIAIFAEFFLPKIDGVVTRTLQTIKCLKQMGDEVLIFAANSELTEYCNAPIFGLPGIDFPLYPELRLAFPLPRIERKLKEFNPDVVFVICPFCLGLGGIYYAKIMQIPLVISHNTNWALYAKFNGMTWLENPTWKILAYVYKKADATVTISDYTLNELRNIGLKSLYLWRSGVNPSFFNARESEDIRSNLSNGNEQKPLLLFVGRLSAEKNIAFIAQILQEIPEANLAILGDGPERANLEKIFPENRTKFMGYLQGEELTQSYASADVFIFPSEFETFGNVVMEAMASGCPVVACRAGGVQNIISHNETGFLFSPGNVREATEATKTVLYDREKRAEIVLNARKYVANQNWESATNGLKEIFQTAINLKSTH